MHLCAQERGAWGHLWQCTLGCIPHKGASDIRHRGSQKSMQPPRLQRGHPTWEQLPLTRISALTLSTTSTCTWTADARLPWGARLENLRPEQGVHGCLRIPDALHEWRMNVSLCTEKMGGAGRAGYFHAWRKLSYIRDVSATAMASPGATKPGIFPAHRALDPTPLLGKLIYAWVTALANEWRLRWERPLTSPMTSDPVWLHRQAAAGSLPLDPLIPDPPFPTEETARH